MIKRFCDSCGCELNRDYITTRLVEKLHINEKSVDHLKRQ